MESWQRPEVISLWIALALLFVAILSSFILILSRKNFKRLLMHKEREAKMKFQHQKALMAAGIEMQERERKRIASDLHDEMIGNLNGINLMLYQTMEIDKQRILSQIESCIGSVRRITHDLSPPFLNEMDIQDILHEIVYKYKDRFKITTHYSIWNKRKVRSEVKLHLLRIVQELMTNAEKHSKAKRIEFSIRYTPSYLAIKIQDDGTGIKSTKRRGLGLKNLEMRISQLEGGYHINTSTGTGIIILIPISNER